MRMPDLTRSGAVVQIMNSKTRPFHQDPQWGQLDRKLPPDAVILCLLRFGFRASDIAARFDCNKCQVSDAARRQGLPPSVNDSHRWRTNGAPFPKRPRCDIGIPRKQPNLVVNL
jgi:hypothetical protein